jgi:hypothetical protein
MVIEVRVEPSLQLIEHRTSICTESEYKLKQSHTGLTACRRENTVVYRIYLTSFLNLDRCVDRTVLQDLLKSLEYDPSSHPFLKISVGTLLLFRDMQSYQDYLNQLGTFMLREGNRDRYTDTSTSLQGKRVYRSFCCAQF